MDHSRSLWPARRLIIWWCKAGKIRMVRFKGTQWDFQIFSYNGYEIPGHLIGLTKSFILQIHLKKNNLTVPLKSWSDYIDLFCSITWQYMRNNCVSKLYFILMHAIINILSAMINIYEQLTRQGLWDSRYLAITLPCWQAAFEHIWPPQPGILRPSRSSMSSKIKYTYNYVKPRKKSRLRYMDNIDIWTGVYRETQLG